MTKEQAIRYTVGSMVKVVRKNPDGIIDRLIPMAEFFIGNETHKRQLNNFKKSWKNRDNFYALVHRMVDEIDPNCLKTLVENLVLNSAWVGNQKLRENRDKYDLNIPWTILIDPTTACNLSCNGCWASGYGRNDGLELELLDRIVQEGKELGIFMYIFSGGEPLIRKKDLLQIAQKHNDCYFLAFTNGTLVDEEWAARLRQVGNFNLAISMEGTKQETDERRGEGSYEKMITAMKLLKNRGVPFGFSTCYHSGNWKTVGSDEYVQSMIDLGAVFGWYFTYIPVGAGAVTELTAKPEHREYMYHRVREMRKHKSIFLMDFWNDGEYVYGCIAGGRNYFHINARGDVEPCAFIHYSDTNIRKCSLLEALQSPLFQQYRAHQPFNRNHLRPCPLLDNPRFLQEMVHRSGARSTEYLEPEDVNTLTAKTGPMAKLWEPVAERLWKENPRHRELENKEWPGKPNPERYKAKTPSKV